MDRQLWQNSGIGIPTLLQHALFSVTMAAERQDGSCAVVCWASIYKRSNSSSSFFSLHHMGLLDPSLLSWDCDILVEHNIVESLPSAWDWNYYAFKRKWRRPIIWVRTHARGTAVQNTVNINVQTAIEPNSSVSTYYVIKRRIVGTQ